MSESVYVGMACFFLGVILIFIGFIWLKQKRLIEDTPTSRIRSLAMGPVEAYGEVVPAQGKILKSPFSNKDCVYYRYTIEEYRRSGKNNQWVTVKSGEERTHFFLQDDTGVVLVDPKGARISIPMDFKYSSQLGVNPPESVMQFLNNNRISFEGLLGVNKTMRYQEYFIEPKDKLYIFGTAGDNPFVEDATATKGTEDVMIQKGKGKIYYISDKSEKEILKNLGWMVMGGMLGGVISIIIGVVVIFISL
jgi:hypothetical protein